MSIKSVRKETQDRELAEISRRRNIALSLPIVGAAIPFMPLPLTIGIAMITAYAVLRMDQQEKRLSRPVVWDASYVETDIPDGDIRRSTFLGRAMPWTEWKSAVDELNGVQGLASQDAVRKTLIEMYPHMIPFMLSDNIMTRHVALLAATGTGKSELILAIIEQQIRKGAGLIMVEAKSDSDLSGAVYAMMREANRLDDFQLINFEFPEVSHTYNPFFYGDARTAISTAMRLQANSSEEFWKDIARYSLTAAILAMKLQPGSPAFHIRDIIAMLSDFDILQSMILSIHAADSPDHKVGREWLLSYLRYWYDEENESWNLKQFKNLLGGLVSKLSAFGHSEYAHIVNTYNPDVDIKESILSNKVLILSMSALKDKDGVELFGKLFIADLARAVGEIQLAKTKPLMMCPAIFDEYPSFMDEGQVSLFQLARSANVPIIIAFQGVGFLEKIDPTFVENVLGNCWTHVYCDIRDTKTRQFAITLAGTMIKQYGSQTEAASAGQSFGSDQSGALTNDSASTSVSTAYKATREEMIQPEDFSTLDQGDAIIVSKSGSYRARLPMVINKFPAVHFTDMNLTKRPSRGRQGVGAWDRYNRKNEEMLGRKAG